MGVKGYKAFKKGMICESKQYKENTTFEEPGGNICGPGVMHFCENPFDVLDYYPLVDENGDFSDFSEVEAVGEVQNKGNKSATNKLHVGLKLNFKGFVKACVDFTISKTKFNGDWAKIGSSGDGAKIGSSGNGAQIGSSGDWAKIGSSGNGAQIGSSGNEVQIGSSGNGAVIMAAGYNSTAKAKIGSWITLAEWEKTNDFYENGCRIWRPKCVKTEYVDGERIKEDTFYRLVDGKFAEVED